MLDMKLVRKNPKEIEDKLRTKDPNIVLSEILEIDDKIRMLKNESEKLKFMRRSLSKQIGEIKSNGGDTTLLMKESADLPNKISCIDKELVGLEQRFNDMLAFCPNIPMDDIQVSSDPKDNVVLKTYGNKPSFDFNPRNHLELNEGLQLFDFVRGAKVTGTGWPAYKGIGARLEWALIQLYA